MHVVEPELVERRHVCTTDREHLDFEGHYGAPGVGSAWSCKECGKGWSLVGGAFYDPAEMVHLMTEEDAW